MDCKSFDSKHATFIDDTLPGVEMAVMRAHINECVRCARRDADVRRALLLVRNLPQVQVSEGFQDRLRTRLAAEPSQPVAHRSPSAGRPIRWAAAAALMIAAAGVASRVAGERGSTLAVRLPAVVATVPLIEEGGADDSAPAYLASMSTGIPMWPALMLAEEGPLRFVATELQNAAWEGSRPQH
jgi:hypothetical protein